MFQMLVAFLTNDLVFPSRVQPVVERLGGRFQTAANMDLLLAKLPLEAAQDAIVLLDLNSPNVDPTIVVQQLKQLPNPPKAIVAFGPHVHEAKLAAAQAAGCDLVMTRGQFDAQIESLLMQLMGQAAADGG